MQAQPWVSGWAPQNCLPSNTKALNRDKTTSNQGVQWGRAAGGEHQALDIGSVLFAFVSHHRLCHYWKHM